MPARYQTITFEADGVSSTTKVEALNWNDVRRERNLALSHTDKYTYADRWATLTAQQQTEITNFRAALRSIPQDYDDAEDVVFPAKPSWINDPISDSIFTGE